MMKLIMLIKNILNENKYVLKHKFREKSVLFLIIWKISDIQLTRIQDRILVSASVFNLLNMFYLNKKKNMAS